MSMQLTEKFQKQIPRLFGIKLDRFTALRSIDHCHFMINHLDRLHDLVAPMKRRKQRRVVRFRNDERPSWKKRADKASWDAFPF